MKGSNKKFISRKLIKSNINKNFRTNNEEFSQIINQASTNPFLIEKKLENNTSFLSPNDKSSIDLINFNSQNNPNSKLIHENLISRFNNNFIINSHKKANIEINASKKTATKNKVLNFSEDLISANFSYFSSKLRNKNNNQEAILIKNNNNFKKIENENINKIRENHIIRNDEKINSSMKKPKSLNIMNVKENLEHKRNKSQNFGFRKQSIKQNSYIKADNKIEENKDQENNPVYFNDINSNNNNQRISFAKSLSLPKIIKRLFLNNESDKNHFHFNQSLKSFHKELFQRKKSVVQIISEKIIGQVNKPKEEPKIEEITGN